MLLFILQPFGFKGPFICIGVFMFVTLPFYWMIIETSKIEGML